MLTIDDLDAPQNACIDFIGDGEDSLILADVGTGKTVIGYTAAIEAFDAEEVCRWLVLAPLLVCLDTWANEPNEWKHLRSGISVAVACGTPAQRVKALEQNAMFTIVNFENLRWLLEYYPKHRGVDKLPFNGLIIDEVDKLKSCSGKTFKAFRNRIGVFNKRIGMTGTAVPKDLTELWGQVYMVDGGHAFGRSFTRWKEMFFYPTDYQQRKWAPFPGTYEKIIEQLAPITFRLPAPPEVPPVKILSPHIMYLEGEALELYDEVEGEFYAELVDEDGNEFEVDIDNAGVQSGKLQQICAGFMYVEDSDGNKFAIWHSTERFEWLDQLINELAPQQVLIVYQFSEECEELKQRYPDIRVLGGGVSNAKKADAIKAWNDGTIDLLAIHPDSASHGLNLQKSSASHVAFLTSPWSGGAWTQVMGRLARRGNTSPVIYAHTAAFAGTVDEKVIATVTERIANQRKFNDDIAKATGS